MNEGGSDAQAPPIPAKSPGTKRSAKGKLPPPPPPRKSSIPRALEQEDSGAFQEKTFSSLPEEEEVFIAPPIVPRKPSIAPSNFPTEDLPSLTLTDTFASSSPASSPCEDSFSSSSEPTSTFSSNSLPRPLNYTKSMCARRVPSFSPTPKPRNRPSMNRSRSFDQLAVPGAGEEESKETLASANIYMTPKRPVMVDPPVKPREKDPGTISSEQARMSSASTYVTLESLGTSLAKSLPLRIELSEGYMSNQIPHITFSTSDMFNVHFLKQQEVLRVKDSSGHIYSVPLYSTIEIGMVQHCTTAAADRGGKNTLLKTTKVSDIMALKDLPKLMAATRTVKSASEKSSVEEKEILQVIGIKKVPNKKKKVLEVYSMNKSMTKMLPPECAGHFSLSPSMTALPMSSFFKRVPDLFPFKAYLYFKAEDLTVSLNFNSSTFTVPPTSLAQNEVTVLKRVTETAVLASPYFEDCPVDVANSENLIHIPLDRRLNKIEISIVELGDATERNKLYNDTCLALEKINLRKVKYYHDTETELAHHTQTFLYTKCQAKGNTGIQMDPPTWNKEQTKPAASSEHETYESIPEVFRSSKHEHITSLPQVPPSHSRKRSDQASLSSSMSLHSQFSEISSPESSLTSSAIVDPGTRPPYPTPPSKKPLRTTCSHSDMNSKPLPISSRPPHPTPHSVSHPAHPQSTPQQIPKQLLHTHSSPTELQSSTDRYQTPRQALLSSITTFNRESLSSHAHQQQHQHQPPLTLSAGIVPPRDLHRTPGHENAGLYRTPGHESTGLHKTPGHENTGLYRTPGHESTGLHRTPGHENIGLYRTPGHESTGLQRTPGHENTGLYKTPGHENTGILSRTAADRDDLRKRDVHVPLPEPPDTYQVPRKHLPLSSQQPHPPPQQPHPKPRLTPGTADQQTSSHPRRPARSKPPALPGPSEDETDLYEEMRSITTKSGMARMAGTPRGAGMFYVPPADSSGGEASGETASANKKRDSGEYKYEIFDPAVSMKMFKDLKSEAISKLRDVTEKVQDLSERLAKLEADFRTLQEAGQGQSANEGGSEKSLPSSQSGGNREYLKTLSCQQIAQVLEGMGLGQYVGVVKEERLDGEIFQDLDEEMLTHEMGMASRIHRLKVLKLISGDYDARNYLIGQISSI